MSKPLCVMLVAAEASGDDRGAGLARALRARLGEGVRFVVDAACAALGERAVVVYAVDGRFLTPASARAEPLAVAAANWAATARAVAGAHPDQWYGLTEPSTTLPLADLDEPSARAQPDPATPEDA